MICADRFGRLLLAGVAGFAIVTPALAQTAEETNAAVQQQPPVSEASTAPDDADQDTATGDIIVTARRTDERIQRVPSSISAFNERALDRIQATDTTGLQGAVPNLNIVQGRGSSNATNIFIRGIGQPDALQTFDPAVGVYVDDVYLSRIRGNQLDLLDLERIEVLRGPQGTLYGKNTIGGAIKFVTRKPGDDTPRGRQCRRSAPMTNSILRANISGPLSDGISAGVSIMRSSRDGFVEDRNDDREYNDKRLLRRAWRTGVHAFEQRPHRPDRRLQPRRRIPERRAPGQQSRDLLRRRPRRHRPGRFGEVRLEGPRPLRACRTRPS